MGVHVHLGSTIKDVSIFSDLHRHVKQVTNTLQCYISLILGQEKMTIPSAITQFEKCTHCVAGVGEEPRAVHARQDHQPRRRPWHWLHPQRSGAQVIHILMPFPQKWILAPKCPKQSSRPCGLTSRRARVAGWSKCTTKFDKITYWGKLFFSYPIIHMMVFADSAQTEYCSTFHCSCVRPCVRVSQAWHLTFLTYIKA